MEGLMFLPTTRMHAVWAGTVALAILVAFAMAWPEVATQLPNIGPFMPMFSTTVSLTESLTALLLCVQFVIFRQPFLGALSGAYAFVAVNAALQLLVFPGVFTAPGLLGAGPQSAIWIWVFWHGGFAFFILLATTIKRYFNRHVQGISYTLAFTALLIGVPIACAVGLCDLAIDGGGHLLPPLVINNTYSLLLHSPYALSVVVINAITLLTVFGTSRGRTALDLWICVALLAALCDVLLTLNATSRYTLGWYAARCLALVSSTTVLSVLLWEINRLYRNLHAAHEKLTEYSIRDGLTGAYNRGYFEQQFDIEMQRARRWGRPLSVLMSDVDWFKSFNDTFGHQAGDSCLIAIARALDVQAKQAGGFVARYGGEEFVIVLPNADRDTATAVSERLRSTVAALRIAAPPNLPADRDAGVVTMSIGAATLEAPLEDYRTLLSAADQALYLAKHSGRNRVCFSVLGSHTT